MISPNKPRRPQARFLTAATLVSAAIATSTTVTTAATAVAATATAVAATAIATAAAATTATGRTGLARTRFIHGQRAAFHGLPIELGDGFLCVGFRCHRDESEAARFTGELVLHQRDFLDWTDACEHVLEVGFGGVEGKISYV
jgi:hypothetical protein